MKPADTSWPRLAAASRRVTDNRDVTAPYGFSTRIVSMAMAIEPLRVSLFQRFSYRALGLACALMLIAVAANYSVITGAADEATPTGDPVVEILGVTPS